MNVIEVLGWKKFVKEHDVAIKSIDRELYMNVLDVVDNVVKVREVLSPFGSNDINACYYLVNIGQSEWKLVKYTRICMNICWW